MSQQSLIDEFVNLFSSNSREPWTRAKTLLQQNPNLDLNSISTNGWTALTNAVQSRIEASVNWLLEQRTLDPNLTNRNGDSPLILAVSQGDVSISIVRALVQVGGAIYVQSSKGEDAREIAMMLGVRGRRIVDLLNENISWQLCKAYSLCTADLTGRKPVTQESFMCLTCDTSPSNGQHDNSRAYCTSCIMTCHSGHDIVENLGVPNYCHCSIPSPNGSRKCTCCSASAPAQDQMCAIGKLVLVKRGLTFQYKEGVGFEYRPVERARVDSASASSPSNSNENNNNNNGLSGPPGPPTSLSPNLERWPAAMILTSSHAYFYSFWNGTPDSRVVIAPSLIEFITNINCSLESGCFDVHMGTGLIRLTTVVPIGSLINNKSDLLSTLSASLDYQIHIYIRYHDELMKAITLASKQPQIPSEFKNSNLSSKRGSEIAAKLDSITKNTAQKLGSNNNNSNNNSQNNNNKPLPSPPSNKPNNQPQGQQVQNQGQGQVQGQAQGQGQSMSSGATALADKDKKRPPPIPREQAAQAQAQAQAQANGQGQAALSPRRPSNNINYNNNNPNPPPSNNNKQQKPPPPPPQSQQPQAQAQPQAQGNNNNNPPQAAPSPSPAPAPAVAPSSPVPSKPNVPDSMIDCVLKPSDLSLSSTDIMGDGSFAVVYRGELSGTPVAVKRLKNQTLDPKQLDEFNREVAFLRAIRHPNIVLFMGVTYAPYMIVTELLDTSLYKLVHDKKYRLSPAQYLFIARKIAMAVNSLHEKNPRVIHRDLKSLNVLLSDDLRTVKLCDLGLVRLKDKDLIESKLGSPLWMAPEMLRDEGYDEKVDVFAFGMILYEMTTNLLPFKGEITMKQLIDGVAKGGVRPPFPSNIQISPVWRQLIEDCWAQNPSARPDMKTVLERLMKMQL